MEKQPRVRPDKIEPQFPGGERVTLTRIDIAARHLGVTKRVLRRGVEKGSIRGRKFQGKLYVSFAESMIRASAVLAWQHESQRRGPHHGHSHG